MSSYEIQYFGIRGRPEPIRLLLSYLGATWTDTSVNDWQSRKPSTPLGQLPVMIETDGDETWEIPQSAAILRHLARQHDVYGKTEREHTKFDIVVDTAADLQASLSPLLFGPNRGKDPAALKKHFEDVAPMHFRRLEKLLGDGTWFIGTAPTAADFPVYHALDNHLAIGPTCLVAFPTLQAFHDRVLELPTLQAYLAKRRPSEVASLASVLATGHPL